MTVEITGIAAREVVELARWTEQTPEDAVLEAIGLLHDCMRGDIERKEKPDPQPVESVICSDPEAVRMAREAAAYLGESMSDYLKHVIEADHAAMQDWIKAEEEGK